MKITILHGGRFKLPFYKDAVSEYLKRITRYAKITITEYDKKTNWEKFSNSFILCLSERGDNLTTDEFKKRIENLQIHSRDLTFIIGDPFGLPASIKDKIDQKISFGKQTMQHELTFVVLLEQIYRAFTIIRGEPYHK